MSSPAGRRRQVRAGILLAVCAGLVTLGAIAAADGFVYYRTPTEAIQTLRDPDHDERIRVGGMVVPGSVRESDEESVLLVTDGVSELEVRFPGRFPDLVREGEGTVIEGAWSADGAIEAHRLLFRHSNVYRAPQLGAP